MFVLRNWNLLGLMEYAIARCGGFGASKRVMANLDLKILGVTYQVGVIL